MATLMELLDPDTAEDEEIPMYSHVTSHKLGSSPTFHINFNTIHPHWYADQKVYLFFLITQLEPTLPF
jgi:hypothetical protein